MAKEKTLDSRKFQLGRKDAQWAGVDYELPQQIVLMCKCIIIHLHLKVTNVSLFDVSCQDSCSVSECTYIKVVYSTSSRELGSGMM